jgi:hypothetical protein
MELLNGLATLFMKGDVITLLLIALMATFVVLMFLDPNNIGVTWLQDILSVVKPHAPWGSAGTILVLAINANRSSSYKRIVEERNVDVEYENRHGKLKIRGTKKTYKEK